MSIPESNSMSNMPMNGSLMSMKTLTAIAVPAGGTTILKPASYHIML